MRYGGVILLVPWVATAAWAQTVPIPTDYTFAAYSEANQAGSPISTYDFAKAAALCDQPVVAVTGVTTNPRYIRWTDPERPTRDCVLDTGVSTGVLFSLPFGGRYIGKLTAKTMIGGVEFVSDASAASNPFVRGAAPAPVVSVRVGG
jgi:hypothetical protein